jgi:hypothetical protein
MDPATGAGCEWPLVQTGATHTERVVHTLIPSGGVAVKRDGQVVDAKPWHGFLLFDGSDPGCRPQGPVLNPA